MASRRLIVEIIGDQRSLQNALSKSSRQTEAFGSKLAKVGKAAAFAGGTAAIGGLFYTLHAGISEWTDQQKVAAQTEAVLKSTGGVAGITKKHVQDLATAIEHKSGIDDEAVKSSENLLLAFTNIRNEAGKGNDIFDRTVQVVQDYSVRTGKSATTASIAFGKALNDPVKGMGALGRAGVILTDKQKKLIKGWVEHGDKLKAQHYLLKQLETRFGGAAEAAGKTLPGQIEIAKQAFNDWAGDMVGKLIPVLERVVSWVKQNWPEISATIKHVWSTDIKPVFDAFVDLAKQVYTTIRDNWGTIGPIVKGVGTIIQNTVKIIVDALKIVTALLHGDWGAAWSAFKDLVGKALDNVKTLLLTFVTTAKNLGEAIGKALKDAIVAGITGLAGAVWDIVNNIGEYISGRMDAIRNWGERVGTSIKSAIVGGISGVTGAVWDVINNIGTFIAARAGAFVSWGKQIGSGILDGITAGLAGVGKAVAGFADSIGRAIGNGVVTVMNTVIDHINSALKFKIPLPFGKSVTVNPPDIPYIPRFAKGGIVTGPTLAMIGEAGPEAVVPLSGPNRPRGGSSTYNLYFPSYTGDKNDLMRAVNDGVRDLERAGGRLGGTRVQPGFAT